MSCLEMKLNKAGSCYAFDGWRGWGGLIETLLLKLLFLPFPMVQFRAVGATQARFTHTDDYQKQLLSSSL
jgi:hypothetical protein